MNYSFLLTLSSCPSVIGLNANFIPWSHIYQGMADAAFLSGLHGWMFGSLGWSSSPAKLVGWPLQLKSGTAADFSCKLCLKNKTPHPPTHHGNGLLLSNPSSDLDQIKNLSSGDNTKLFENLKWRQHKLEDDFKISKVEYLSNHWFEHTQILNLNFGDQTKLHICFIWRQPLVEDSL